MPGTSVTKIVQWATAGIGTLTRVTPTFRLIYAYGKDIRNLGWELMAMEYSDNAPIHRAQGATELFD